MWWVPTGHIPTAVEAKEKLELLARHGASAQAFTLRRVFDPPLTVEKGSA